MTLLIDIQLIMIVEVLFDDHGISQSQFNNQFKLISKILILKVSK